MQDSTWLMRLGVILEETCAALALSLFSPGREAEQSLLLARKLQVLEDVIFVRDVLPVLLDLAARRKLLGPLRFWL